MADHDPQCSCARREHRCETSWAGDHCTRCDCDLIARVVDREVERHHPTRRTAHGFALCQRCHTESVAARLVEVICEQDILLREWVAERKRLEPMLAARVDADYCTGCDLPLARCLTHHAETGGKCCPECQHPVEAQAFTTLRARAQALERERSSQVLQLANLRAQIAADIEALHYPEAVFAYEVKADAARIARGES